MYCVLHEFYELLDNDRIWYSLSICAGIRWAHFPGNLCAISAISAVESRVRSLASHHMSHPFRTRPSIIVDWLGHSQAVRDTSESTRKEETWLWYLPFRVVLTRASFGYLQEYLLWRSRHMCTWEVSVCYQIIHSAVATLAAFVTSDRAGSTYHKGEY